MADLAAKLPGRGAWVSASRAAVENATAKGLFSRAFKRPASAPSDLARTVEAGLEKRALAALGLARRAGDATIGFDQVRALLRDGDAAVFISAVDGAEGGYLKLAALAGEAIIVRAFAGRDLSAALGRDGVVHAALRKSASADRFMREIRRLDGFRPAIVGNGAQDVAKAL